MGHLDCVQRQHRKQTFTGSASGREHLSGTSGVRPHAPSRAPRDRRRGARGAAVGIGFGAMQPLTRPDEEFFALRALGLFSHPSDALANGWPGGYASLTHAMVRLERIFSLGDANLACALAVRPLSIYLPARILNAVIGAAS